jgi:DNA repair photolyase
MASAAIPASVRKPAAPKPFPKATPTADARVLPEARRGRGAAANPTGRFERFHAAVFDDGWGELDEEIGARRTEVMTDTSRTVIARNTSPDIPFDRSINPYRGCEHGCIYCFARPSHAYLGLSPGLDFESRIFAKPDAAARLREELARPNYKVAPMAMGTNTDPYQPLERRLGIMRSILEVLDEVSHPLSIVTKSHLITRDVDILGRMAKRNLVRVFVSVTTLDSTLARKMEPRAATPARRLDAIKTLHDAGIPVGVMAAPMIPALNDHEMENILAAARKAGARSAGYILVRLPLEVRDLFVDWLKEHYPDRAERVMSRLRAMRGGRDNDSQFGSRMRGSGAEAELLSLRFHQAAKRLGFNRDNLHMNCKLFTPPVKPSAQMTLF